MPNSADLGLHFGCSRLTQEGLATHLGRLIRLKTAGKLPEETFPMPQKKELFISLTHWFSRWWAELDSNQRRR
jgi:hypothetical protein